MISVCTVTAYFLRNAGQRWSDYGACWNRKVLRKIVVGLLSGCLLAFGWAGVIWYWAPFQWKSNNELAIGSLVGSIAATCAMGIAEEVGYRSFGTERALRFGGITGAVLIPSSIFVLVHIAGGVPWLAGLLVVGSCSATYGLLMLMTRSLPLVAAFHIGNNLVQDTFLRTSSGSIVTVVYAHPTQAQNHSLEIWLGMAIVNCMALGALVALGKRGGRKAVRITGMPSVHCG